MHTRHHDDSGGFSNSKRGRDGPAASRKEANEVETRTGAGRETDTTSAIETETDKVAETATESTR